MSQNKYKSDALEALHETAKDLHEVGLLSKRKMRQFDGSCLTNIEKLTPDQIKAVREETLTSQSVFARYLGVTPNLISKWESGERKPTGPALKLLNLVKTKGLDCIA